MIRVLIAEDSITCRDLLVAVIGTDPELTVIGHAANGQQAIAMTHQLHPDVIVMDVHMPVMDGFEATRQIMCEAPTPIVIVSATVNIPDITASMQALRVGALAVLAKPALGDAENFPERARDFTASIRTMAGVRVVRRWDASISAQGQHPRSAHGRISLIAIAASTGGPGALHTVLSGLPADLPVPVLVVQHIAVGFVEGLAKWLDQASPMTVQVARHGDPIKAGNVYIAPDEGHLGLLDHNALAISHTAPVGGFRPSATFLFDAVARVYGSRGLGVVLTGMGDDGLLGLRQLHRVGGRIVVQDEQSSVVFGMPGAAVAAGLVETTLPLEEVARWVRACWSPRAQV